MKTMKLTKRDRLILQHIYEFNITMVDIVHQLYFENLKIGAAESTLRRLREKHGLLSRDQLYGDTKKYFRLTPAGGEMIGKQVEEKEFGGDKVAASYANLHFLCIQPKGIVRTKCDPKQHPKLFPSSINPPSRIDFYISENKLESPETPSVSLGAIFPDLNSKVRRINDRCVNQARKFIQRGWFAGAMKAGRFEMTVLTGTESKKKAIEANLNRQLRMKLRADVLKHGLSSPVRFPIRTDVVVIPGLNTLIPQTRKTKRNGKQT